MIERSQCLQQIEGVIATQRAAGGLLGLLLLRLQHHGQFNLLLETQQIQAASARIESLLRPDDRLLRIGACDFMVLLNGLRSPLHATLAANRVVSAFREAMVIEEREVLLNVHAGVSLFPDHGDSAELIWRAAELALADSHADPHGYRMGGSSPVNENIAFDELHQAIANNQLQVYFQGVFDLCTLRMVSVESLARWQNQRLGWISPESFVRFAERAGLIEELTRWSINASLRDIGLVRAAGLTLPVAINLSARVLHVSGLVEQILDALALWEIAPETVLVEVTESAVMADVAHSAQVLARLRDAGIGIAIDDFGTGQSSFDYLRQFPVTELKIDRRFVVDVTRESRTARLVSAMVDLAHTLGSKAVAEGVEDQRTAIMLREMGCDRGQGHYFGVSGPVRELIERQAQESPAWSLANEQPLDDGQQRF